MEHYVPAGILLCLFYVGSFFIASVCQRIAVKHESRLSRAFHWASILVCIIAGATPIALYDQGYFSSSPLLSFLVVSGMIFFMIDGVRRTRHFDQKDGKQ